MGKINSQNKLRIDKSFLILIFLLTFLGLITVADASAPQSLSRYGDKFYLFKQQAEWTVIGLFAFLTTSKINYKFWEKIATPLFFITVFLLMVVLLPHLGFKALGARRWIDVGFFSFQPSELIKIVLAMYLAKVASKAKNPLSYFAPVVLVIGLVMLQPDLGTTMVISILAMSQIFVTEVNIIYFLGSLGAGLMGILGLIVISPYRKERLLTFLQMERDPLGSSYHIRQVLLSLGSGGIFGVGLGASRQKYLFLPESSTDSVFAVIGEELGFLGALGVILIYSFFIFKGLSIAKNAPDTFSKVLATGITAWVGGQVFLNIASMVALVPLTGIPLPFLSYGGSSLVMVMSACGILLNISKNSETAAANQKLTVNSHRLRRVHKR